MYDRYTYRGKRVDNGEWVYGAYMHQYYSQRFGRVDAIFYSDGIMTYEVPINPATLGQCTGIPAAKSHRGEQPKDLMVFEGDVVIDNQGRRYIVEWRPETPGLSLIYRYTGGYTMTPVRHVQKMHIVANTHDNPEMAGGAGWREVPHEAD